MWARQSLRAENLRRVFDVSKAFRPSRADVKRNLITASATVPLPLTSRPILTAVKKFENQVFVQKSSHLVHSRGFGCIALDKEMEKHCIVPDVLPEAPKSIAQVTFPSGVKVDMGNELTPTQVKCAPEVTWDADPNSLYVLCMTDPDAPSRGDPKFREWQHWLVGNIPGSEICRGDLLSAYIGSGPPPKTGLHRYIILIYKQPKKICFDEKRLPNNSGEGRANFKIADFAKKYELGNPIAGNFFQAEYDDYVPELYKKLGA